MGPTEETNRPEITREANVSYILLEADIGNENSQARNQHIRPAIKTTSTDLTAPMPTTLHRPAPPGALLIAAHA